MRIPKTAVDLREWLILLLVVLRACSVSRVQNVYRIAVFGLLIQTWGCARMTQTAAFKET